jgi:osmotically inducible protein OsmC
MALALELTEAGHPPTRIATTARVGIEKTADGLRIPRIELETEGEVPGIDSSGFEQHAESAKTHCPVSLALAATEIRLTAKLTQVPHGGAGV